MRPQIVEGDLQALLSASRALSEVADFDRLVEGVIVWAVDHARADVGALFVQQGDVMQITAQAMGRGEAAHIVERDHPSGMVEDFASPWRDWQSSGLALWPLPPATERHASEPYVSTSDRGDGLCIPLVAQKRLIGGIQLMGLVPRELEPSRLVWLQMLGSHAAVLIDNAILRQRVSQAEQDARQARDEWSQEFDLLPVQAWRTDAVGVLEVANKHWYDFTGMTQDDAGGEDQQYRNTCHPDDSEKVFGLLSRLHETGVAGEVECRMLRCDGVYRRVLARAAPLHDQTGAVIKWHGTTIDIEDLKRAEEAQEALARISRVTALGELAVSIAHEVNQPLMSIVTNAGTCLNWLAPERANIEEARMAAERIVRDGHRAGAVIASIRELARKAPPTLVELDVNDVVEEVLALTRNELERHEISVRTQLTSSSCPTLADRVQIQQVVLNLIVNGIEAMDGEAIGSRTLVVATERIDNAFIALSVSDTGCGLQAADAERVFDAFVTSKVGGIGMGLSICRSIVENHGGRMAVSANNPRGCTFSVHLPTIGGPHDAAPHH